MGTTRKLPIGIQNFESLIRDGYVYIDKTAYVHKLISTGRYYFLSRPRRFGKSMLISTLSALFEGKRELFKGLAIDSMDDVDWTPRPVLHLDLNTNKYESKKVLDKKLEESLSQWETLYGCERLDLPAGMRFENVIRKACEQTGHRVVILVDEYDKPMLQAIGDPELLEEFRSTLKGFYGALKSMDGCIKFALVTGVTKFSKVSVFSDLNNLRDISMSRDYSSICGITEDELLTVFKEDLETLAKENNLSVDGCKLKLRQRYDGYHFEETAPGIYNPFSILNTFAEMRFGSYWFETGTPTYLVELLQKSDWNLEEMSHQEVDGDSLNAISADSLYPIPVIYQSGYLTITGYDKRFRTYTLGFPNEEVEEGFTKFLMPFYVHPRDRQSPFLVDKFVSDVEAGRTEQFIQRLRSLFADTPYEIVRDLENHYQNVLWLLYKLMGFYTQAEYHTSQGRIDLVVKTPKYCYVMEFKLDGTAEEALAQISDRNYTLPFALEGQKVVRIGINFSKETRNIDGCIYA